MHRKLKLSWPQVMMALAALRALCPAPLSLAPAMHEAADMQDSQVIEERLTIRNPFRQA